MSAMIPLSRATILSLVSCGSGFMVSYLRDIGSTSEGLGATWGVNRANAPPAGAARQSENRCRFLFRSTKQSEATRIFARHSSVALRKRDPIRPILPAENGDIHHFGADLLSSICLRVRLRDVAAIHNVINVSANRGTRSAGHGGILDAGHGPGKRKRCMSPF